MKNYLLSQFIGDKKYIYISLLLSFSIIAFYHISNGYVMSPDSYTYSRWADELIKLEFNFISYYAQNTFIAPSFFYTTPVLIISLMKVIFEAEWQTAFLIFNLSLLLLSQLLIIKSLLLLEVRPVLISLTMFVLITSVDLLVWPRYVLSDMIFSFLVILSIYIMIKGFVTGKLNFIGIISVIGIIFLSRPSSLPILFTFFSFFVITRFQILTKPKIILLLFLLFFIITPLFFSYLHQLSEINLNENKLTGFLFSMVKEGMIIHDRPETWISSPISFIDVSYLYFIRLINFFRPYIDAFSSIHILLNSLVAIIILFSITIWIFFGGKIKSHDKTILFILLLSFFVAAYHAFTLIDYDWRYRFPIIMPLIMIFPITLEILFKKVNSKI